MLFTINWVPSVELIAQVLREDTLQQCEHDHKLVCACCILNLIYAAVDLQQSVKVAISCISCFLNHFTFVVCDLLKRGWLRGSVSEQCTFEFNARVTQHILLHCHWKFIISTYYYIIFTQKNLTWVHSRLVKCGIILTIKPTSSVIYTNLSKERNKRKLLFPNFKLLFCKSCKNSYFSLLF